MPSDSNGTNTHTHARKHACKRSPEAETILPPEEKLPLPVASHSAKGRNGACSSDGPYEAKGSSIPEPTLSLRRQIEGYRGGGGRDRTGEERFSANTHLCSWSATGIYPDWNKGCKHSSACPPLQPPPTHPASRSYAYQGAACAQRTTAHTHSPGRLLQKKKNGASGDGGGR